MSMTTNKATQKTCSRTLTTYVWGCFLACFTIGFFFGSGCYSEPDFPERFRSEHFAVFSNFKYDRAQGEQWLNEWLEKHYDIHMEYLGATANRREPIRIYIFDRHDEFVQYCAEGVAACTPIDRPVAYSTYLGNTHELIHIYSREFGFATPFFNEGLAHMLSSQAYIPGDLVPKDRDIRSLLVGELNQDDSDMGALTSSFTRFLVDLYGTETFMRFFEHLEDTQNLSGLRNVFAQVFSDSLENAIQRWRSAGNITRGDATLNLAQCDSPQLNSLHGEGEEIVLRWGPRRGSEDWSAIRTFEVLEPSQLRLRAAVTNSQMMLHVQGCQEEQLTDGVDMHVYAFGLDALRTPSSPTSPERTTPVVSHELLADVGPGRYWVALSGKDDEQPPSATLAAELTNTLWDNEEPVLVGGELQQVAVVRDADACRSGVCETSVFFQFEERAMMGFRPQEVFPFETMDVTQYIPRGPQYLEVCRRSENQWVDCVAHTEINRGTVRSTFGEAGDVFRVTLGQTADTSMATYFTFNLDY
jgi:hypothetical protein